jgi:disulfide bond formation protein DsbB
MEYTEVIQMEEIIEGLAVIIVAFVVIMIQAAIYALLIYGVLWFLGLLLGIDVTDVIVNYMQR